MIKKMSRNFKILLKKMYFEMRYFWYLLFYKPSIMSFKETIDYINQNKSSISRFGDGELDFALDSNKEILFQNRNTLLGKRLREILSSNNKNVLICLPSLILPKNRRDLTHISRSFWRHYSIEKIPRTIKLINKKYRYGNTDISRFYLNYTDKSFKTIDYKVKLLKKIWDNRNVIVVEGLYTRLGVGNDLFGNTISMRRIICPAKNAFDQYNKIYTSVIDNYHADDLVIIALGPTATVLAYDLGANKNIQAIDIGHIDMEYLWFINGVDYKAQMPGRNFSEDSTFDYENDDFVGKSKYQEEIIFKVF